MAHGLETRVPFLDNDLVDFAMRCPVRLKLNNLAEVVRINENEPGDKQATLLPEDARRQADPARRDAAATSPRTSTSAEKQGFSAPDASWFKGESIDSSSGGCSTGTRASTTCSTGPPCRSWWGSTLPGSRTGGC